jgi:outer membrane protein assembly factor BamB
MGISFQRISLTILFIIIISINSFPNTIADNWLTYRHDNLNSGFTESESPNTNQLNWTVHLNTSLFKEESILIDDDNLIISDGYYLKCLSVKNLTLKWKYKKIDDYTCTALAISDNKVYFSDGPDYLDRSIYCLNMSDGSFIWSFSASFIKMAPSINGKRMFFPAKDAMYCIDKNTGKLIWKHSSEYVSILDSPPVEDGRVIFACDDFDEDLYWISCLDENTGEKIWDYKIKDEIATIAIYNKNVYFGSDDHYFRCLDLKNGELLWKFKTESLITSAPAFHEDKVFFGSWDNKIYCLDYGSGKFIWSYETGDWIMRAPTVADGKTFIGSDDGYIYALDETNGALLWKYNTGHDIQSSPVVANGSLFIISGYRLYCFSKDHEIKEQDLFINDYDLSYDPIWVDEGTKSTDVTITAKVHNMGEMEGNNNRQFTIGFYEKKGDSSKLIERKTQTLSNNGLNIVEIEIKIDVEQSNSIIAKIEDTNFEELNPSNNEAVDSVRVDIEEEGNHGFGEVCIFIGIGGAVIGLVIFLIILLEKGKRRYY